MVTSHCISIETGSYPQNILILKISGLLDGKDYQHFVPEIERIIRLHGPVRLLFNLVDFRGWTETAAWEDTKFGLAHKRDIKRMAIVSDDLWADLANVSRPFPVRYFNTRNFNAAIDWLSGYVVPPTDNRLH